MARALSSVAALLLASALLLAGNGLQSTLVALRANLESFPLTVIGLLMSVYYAGFVAGCFHCPRIVARVGHIRAFAAFAALASAATVTHALFVEPIVWLALRAIIGFAFAGLYMVSESWINENATNENRGKVLSIYRLIDFGASTVGQLMLNLADPAGFPLFCLATILITMALVPVALTSNAAPRPIEGTQFNLRKVLSASPLAAWTCLTAGLANGAFWGLGPVFIQNAGYDLSYVSLFMSAVILGAALMQYPFGHLSDHFDRRYVLIVIAAGSALSSFWLANSPAFGFTAIAIAGFVYGAFALSLYAMAVAHANDFASREDFVDISSGLLFLFGIGAIVGPFVAGSLISNFGNNSLFVYTAGIQTLLFLYGLYRVAQRPSIPLRKQEEFVPSPRSTPQILELDPRSNVDLDEPLDTASAEIMIDEIAQPDSQ